jgi:hypothetical protein
LQILLNIWAISRLVGPGSPGNSIYCTKFKHPQATFLLRVRGESMKDAGIFDNDVVLVDRAIHPRSGHVVVAVVDGEFVCKTLWQRAGGINGEVSVWILVNVCDPCQINLWEFNERIF